jgi:hypothetical protein
MMASRRLVLAATVDGAGRKVAGEAVRQVYGAGPEVGDEEQWDAGALRAL